MYFLTCRLNSISAHYKASRKTHTHKTKTVQIYKNKTANRPNKNKKTGQSNVNEVLGPKQKINNEVPPTTGIIPNKLKEILKLQQRVLYQTN